MSCAQLIAWERRLASIERRIAWQKGYEAGRRSAVVAFPQKSRALPNPDTLLEDKP